MEENKEMKNGMISEEALDEIAGGLSVKKGLLIGALAAAGVGVAGAGALAAWKYFGKKEEPINPNPLKMGEGILHDAETIGKAKGPSGKEPSPSYHVYKPGEVDPKYQTPSWETNTDVAD